MAHTVNCLQFLIAKDPCIQFAYWATHETWSYMKKVRREFVKGFSRQTVKQINALSFVAHKTLLRLFDSSTYSTVFPKHKKQLVFSYF